MAQLVKKRTREGGSKRKLKSKQLLETAPVHTSLPPLVEGTLRGHVSVSLREPVQWKCCVRPPAPKLSIRLRWWGEKGTGTLFRVPVLVGQSKDDEDTICGPRSAYYPIRAGLPQFKAYLKDMGAVVLEVGLGHMTDSSMVIGRAAVSDVMSLVTTGQLEGSYAVVSPGDVHLGQLKVLFQLHTNTSLDKKPAGAKKSAPKVLDTLTEFIVGPGASFKTSTSLQKGDKKWSKFKEVPASRQKPAIKTPKDDVLAREAESSASEKESTPEGDVPETVIGRQQMAVISELLERGTMLRDKMVDSLAAGALQDTRQVRADRDSEREELASPRTLALVSAELAARNQDQATGQLELLYNTHSSEEEISTVLSSASSSSPEPALVSRNPVTTRPAIREATTRQPCPPTRQPQANRGSKGRGAPSQSDKKQSEVSKDESGSGDEENTSDKQESQGVIESASLRSLSSLFGQTEASIEQEISRTVGLEQLTRLSRATSVRVLVHNLSLDPSAVDTIITHNQQHHKTRHLSNASSALSCAYFVEYQFPAALLNTTSTSRLQQHFHELMRVAAKKMKTGTVTFNHCSVFPVLLNSKVLQSWWNRALIFRVYCRPSQERMPYLVGKAVAPLKTWLTSPALQSHLSLPVHSSSLADALHVGTHDDPCIGQLQVSIEMLTGKKLFSPLPSPPKLDSPKGPSVQHQPIRVKETVPKSAAATPDPSTPALQLLLLIPEAINIQCPSPSPASPVKGPVKGSPNPPEGPPNCYLVCKLFLGEPYPRSPVEWKTANPQFLFRQLFPLALDKTVVQKCCNNYSVVEVWHRGAGQGTDDQLVGLVKLSLHQFFLAFSEPASASLSTRGQLPVVAVDSYCPIVDPIAGHTSGHLAVLLALGTPDQVSHLLRQHADGMYTLQRPYTTPQRCENATTATGDVEGVCPKTQHPSLTHHQFIVQVGGVRQLEVGLNTVWGEADCFVQYHFPTQSEDACVELLVEPYRTNTTLYMPNPAFSHETVHSMSLPGAMPIGQALATACGRGMSGHIPFELWRRFYFPNIRDQLLAKASLPLVKLCALVGMHSSSTASAQTFSLPLQPLFAESKVGSVGVLDVTVSYRAVSQHNTDPQQPLGLSFLVNLSLGVLRMAGLKRAALMAAKDHPLPLDFAAEAGVNPYAKISTAHILPDPKVTKTAARTFAPEMSHFMEVSVPFGQIPSLAAGELLQASLLVEVWHQVPRRDSPTSEPCSHGNKVTGRRLGPSFRDVLLGVAHVPLSGLLSHTGVHGWFPLLPPATPHILPVSGPAPQPHVDPPAISCAYVGGVEISAAFSSKRDRQQVLSAAEQAGWQPPKLLDLDVGGGAKHWAMTLEVTSLWVQRGVLLGANEEHSWCFVRYKFFYLDPVSSTPRRPSVRLDDHRAHYPLQHKSRLLLPASLQLEWYLCEECMEIQLWSSTGAHPNRPVAGDILLGSVYILLADLLTSRGNVSGWYPLYKVGVDDLGQQALYVSLSLCPSQEEGEIGRINIMDGLTVEPVPPSVSPGPEEGGVARESQDLVQELKDAVFEAVVVIHEALHLPLLKDTQRGEYLPSPYVTLHPHPSVSKVETAVMESNRRPCWEHQCVTSIPTLYLQPQCTGLELQVWSKETGQDDRCIGCVLVDISPLAFGLPQLSGWYHIVDFGGEIQGQLRVSVIPKERRNFPSPLAMSKSQISDVPSTHVMECPPILPQPSSSTTTSLLFQQLKTNIQDLDHLHVSLQAKLEAAETQEGGGTQDRTRQFSSTEHSIRKTSGDVCLAMQDTAFSGRQGITGHLRGSGHQEESGHCGSGHLEESGHRGSGHQVESGHRGSGHLEESGHHGSGHHRESRHHGSGHLEESGHRESGHHGSGHQRLSGLEEKCIIGVQDSADKEVLPHPLPARSPSSSPHLSPTLQLPGSSACLSMSSLTTESSLHVSETRIHVKHTSQSAEHASQSSITAEQTSMSSLTAEHTSQSSMARDVSEGSISTLSESSTSAEQISVKSEVSQQTSSETEPVVNTLQLSPHSPTLSLLPANQPSPPSPSRRDQPPPSPSRSGGYHMYTPQPPATSNTGVESEGTLSSRDNSPPLEHDRPNTPPSSNHLHEVHRPEPRLPNFFLSPQRLEQSMRTIRMAALTHLPPLQPHPLLTPPSSRGKGGGARDEGLKRPVARQRTSSETERIARIFSSKS